MILFSDILSALLGVMRFIRYVVVLCFLNPLPTFTPVIMTPGNFRNTHTRTHLNGYYHFSFWKE